MYRIYSGVGPLIPYGYNILVMADDYVYIVVVNNVRECQNMMVNARDEFM